MMNIYLLDDDPTIRRILKQIIKDRSLGIVCGSTGNAPDALEDLPILKPDLLIVDLLMPEMDGISFIRKAKAILPDAACLMLSQVSSKDMISSAYEAGAEFYIQKPLNSIEVESVIRKVSDTLSMKRMVRKMQNIFLADVPQSLEPDHRGAAPAPAAASSSSEPEAEYMNHLRLILTRLGIIGEAGSKDIQTAVNYLVLHPDLSDKLTVRQLCTIFCDAPKSMEQRIRRTAAAGLCNLAHLGIDDYSNEFFSSYAGTIYNFEQVRREMDYIQGKSAQRGNVRIRSFLTALAAQCQI